MPRGASQSQTTQGKVEQLHGPLLVLLAACTVGDTAQSPLSFSETLWVLLCGAFAVSEAPGLTKGLSLTSRTQGTAPVRS